jgi:HAMP domain-containing protein
MSSPISAGKGWRRCATPPAQNDTIATPKKVAVQSLISPKEEAVQSLRKTLGLILWDQSGYEELLVIDPAGIVVASTFRGHEGKTAASIDYFTKGKLSTFIQPVFVSPITEQLTMVVATPIKNENRNMTGVLAARLNLNSFFRLIGDQTGLGTSGETVVAKKIGSEVVFMAPTRHDDLAALNRKVPIGSPSSTALQDASRGQAGSGPSIDYRQREVFAAWQLIPSLDWGLIIKIDQDECRAAVVSARTHATILATAIALLGLLCAVVISRTMVRSLRELREAAEKISKGDLDVNLIIRAGDEVGDLADSFERMIAAIRFFKDGDKSQRGLCEISSEHPAPSFAKRDANGAGHSFGA